MRETLSIIIIALLVVLIALPKQNRKYLLDMFFDNPLMGLVTLYAISYMLIFDVKYALIMTIILYVVIYGVRLYKKILYDTFLLIDTTFGLRTFTKRVLLTVTSDVNKLYAIKDKYGKELIDKLGNTIMAYPINVQNKLGKVIGDVKVNPIVTLDEYGNVVYLSNGEPLLLPPVVDEEYIHQITNGTPPSYMYGKHVIVSVDNDGKIYTMVIDRYGWVNKIPYNSDNVYGVIKDDLLCPYDVSDVMSETKLT